MNSSSSSVVSHPGVTPEQTAKASRYLAETRDALVKSVSGLAAAQWNFKPVPDCWSAAEIVEHVTLIEKAIHGIVARMKDALPAPADFEQEVIDEFISSKIPERSTKFKAPEQFHPGRWSGPEALQYFLESRQHTITLLSAPSLRGHVIPHPVCGPWDGYHWLLAAAAHSARHTAQICEIKADPSFLEAGRFESAPALH